jgi:hypothetical protein
MIKARGRTETVHLEQLLHPLRTQLTTALKSGKIVLNFLYFDDYPQNREADFQLGHAIGAS